MQRTYETRLRGLTPEQEVLLGEMARELSRLERAYFRARHVQGRGLSELKKEFPARYGITGRQFTALRMQVDGKVEAAREATARQLEEVRGKIVSAEKQIGKLEKQQTKKQHFTLHQKRRRLARLRHRERQIAEAGERRVPRLCFGSNRLFRAQFALSENGYASHAEWKADWEAVRASQFFLVGSHDETAGNQGAQISLAEDGSGVLRIRLTDAVAKRYGAKHLDLPVRFSYGIEVIRWGLGFEWNRDKKGRCVRRGNAALSWRLIRRRKQDRKTGRPKGPWTWYAQVSLDAESAPVVTDARNGALGIDLNPDPLAVAQLDRHGNPVRVWHRPVLLTDRRSGQVEAALGDAAAEIVAYAREHRIPIVIEQLDFAKKRTALEAEGVPYRRMLSSFAYRIADRLIRSRAHREGVEVKAVNPAYTSVIGEVKFARGYGLSRHGGAAVAIGRRGMNFQRGERLRGRGMDRAALHNASRPSPNPRRAYPKRGVVCKNGREHVWSAWSRLHRALRQSRLGYSAAPGSLTASRRAPPAWEIRQEAILELLRS